MGYQSYPTLTLTRKASAALTPYRFVSLANGVPSAGGNTLGVTHEAVASGAEFPLIVAGTVTVEASAAIADGAKLETTNDGRAVTADSGVTVARALQAASGAGVKFEALLIPN